MLANEKYGPASDQIFDLARRRHPIKFTSPVDGMTRKQVIDELASDLDQPLRQIVSMGLSGRRGDDEDLRHERQRNEMENYRNNDRRDRDTKPTILVTFRPKRYLGKRFPSAEALEELARRRQAFDGRHEYPPQRRGT